MWDEQKRQQFDKLRRRQGEQGLTEEEQQTLEQLLYELEQEEWVVLKPALERKREEQKRLRGEYMRLRSQNAGLAALAERYEDLLARAKAQFTTLLNEHETLKSEYEQITGQPLISPSS